MSEASPATKEFEAIKVVHTALEALDKEGRARVLGYIASLLDIEAKVTKPGSKKNADDAASEEGEAAADAAAKSAKNYSTFADLYSAAGPESNGEKALVAGYWLQVCQGAEGFASQAANKELTNLGHGVANITDAINSVKDLKPSLILQVKKSGTSKQARKLYKVSHEGLKRVEAMISG